MKTLSPVALDAVIQSAFAYLDCHDTPAIRRLDAHLVLGGCTDRGECRARYGERNDSSQWHPHGHLGEASREAMSVVRGIWCLACRRGTAWSPTCPNTDRTCMVLPSTPSDPDIQGAPQPPAFPLPEVRMTSFFSHLLLPSALAAVVISGCKSGQRQSENTSPPPASTSEVTAKDIERAPGQSIEEILKGRVAGVTVTRTEGGISVRIRGASSLYGSSEPLYVLDGVAIQPGAGGSLTGIDPYDIESIEVLKDPADTAMYGMRGANGVIVIKTKRAQRRKNPS